jgi:hypothetical protein
MNTKTVSSIETIEKQMQHIPCGYVLRVVTRFYDCTFTQKSLKEIIFSYDHCDVTFYTLDSDEPITHCPQCSAELPVLKHIPPKAERHDSEHIGL